MGEDVLVNTCLLYIHLGWSGMCKLLSGMCIVVQMSHQGPFG